MWHVSVSVQPLRPVARWTAEQRAAVRALAVSTLHGVGADDIWHEGDRVVHLRRRMTDAEQALLDAEWRALDAEDMGGGEDCLLDDWR